MSRKHPLPGSVEHTVEAPEYDERRNDLTVVRLLVVAPEQIGNAPDEAGDLVETLELTWLDSIGSAICHAGLPRRR